MKNFLLVSSLLLCFSCKENGVKLEQPTTFVHYYNGGTPDVAQTIIKTSDGGYLIMANTQTKITSTHYRIKLIKVDAYGNEVWNRIIPKYTSVATTANYRGFGVTAVTDNSGSDTGYFIVGEEIYNDPNNNGNRTQGLLMIQIHLDPTTPAKGVVKIDSVTKKVADIGASVRGLGVAKAKNGNYYVLGKQFPPINNPGDPNDMFLTEIDASTIDTNSFSSVWVRSYGAASTALVNSVFTYGDSIYWGGTRTAGTLQEMRLVSTQINTGAQIDNTFPEVQAAINYSCSDICKYGFGYGFVGSYSTSTGVYDGIAFFKVDGNGKASESMSYKLDNPLQPPFQAAGNSICSTQDGGFLMLGTAPVDASNSDTNYLLIKTDGHGVMQWTKQYGGRFVDVGAKVLQATDGGFIVLGTTNLGNVESIFLMKTDSEGNIQ